MIAPILLAVTLISIVNVRRALVLNADVATPAVMAEAFVQHGTAALRAWGYTQDNWLLSVLLPNLLADRIIGLPPGLILAEGWFTFAVQCAAIGMLAGELIGRVRSALLAALLLCASPRALGQIGALAHPVSHGVTAAWALPAVWLLARSLARATGRGGRWRAVLAGLLLLIAGVSDPWAKAAFLLPLLAAAVIATCSASLGAERRQGLVCASVPAVLLIAGSHMFGILRFLPSSRLDHGGVAGMPARLAVVGRALAVFFPIIPGSETTRLWIADDSVLLLIITVALGSILRPARKPSIQSVFLAAWAAFSLAGTITAFALSGLPPEPGYGRFFLNAYAAIPLLGCLLVATKSKVLLVLPIAGFLISSCLVLARPAPADKDTSAADLAAFLDRHDLTYGYGGYWSSQANAIRWISGGHVTIRPLASAISGNAMEPRRPQSFPWWYRPSDIPPHQSRFFFVAAPEPDLCPDQPACVALAVRAFGPPVEIVRYARADIMVWDHPLLDGLPSFQRARALPALTVGAGLDFTRSDSTPYVHSGWSMPGPRGITGLDERAIILVPAGRTSASEQVCVSARLAARRGAAALPVRVAFGTRPSATWMVSPRFADYCAENPTADPIMVIDRRPRGDGTPLPGLVLRTLTITPVRK